MKKTISLIFILHFTSLAGMGQKAMEIKSVVDINMDKRIGVIRPLQGGNLGPVNALRILNLTDYFKECKIPLVRLHDVTWFGTNAVDVSTIFKNFADDPLEASNYDFRQTDDYIASIVETGADIIYRLGQSIEWTKRKYYVNPPQDFNKWAVICKHIIMHYNEGWDDGFHYNIKYWEIWNEPNSNREPPGSPKSWTGKDEEFFSLYEIAARTIKENFPQVKVGGPAAGAAVDIKDGKVQINDFTDKFLRYCQKESVPLDFFSWHNYNQNPWELARLPGYVRDILNQQGFPRTESILDEWNYLPPSSWSGMLQQGVQRAKWFEELSSVKGGAFIADVLMLLQDQPIDAATLYTVEAGMFGLFSDMGVPHKSAYAFEAFSALVNHTPFRLETRHNVHDSLAICTGTNKEKTELDILISNFTSEGKKIDLQLSNNFLEGPINYEVYAVDEKHNLSKIKEYKIENKRTLKINQDIRGPSVFLLKLSSAK